MTDKEKVIEELKETLDSLDITNKYRLNLIRAIEYLQEEPVEKDFEKALASEWKAYNDRGAATVDALEDNTQELAFAKGFYRGAKWKEQKDSIVSEDLEEAASSFARKDSEGISNPANFYYTVADKARIFKAGSNWKEQQMVAKAIDGKVIANGMGNPILHLWDKGKHLIDKEVKVIVIKED